MLARGRAGDDAQVGHALGNGLHDAQARVLLHIHAHAWVLGKVGRQQFGQVLGQGRGVAQQAHLALMPLCVLTQVELQAFDLLGDEPGMLQQCLPGGGGADTPAIAQQECNAQGRLHGTNPSAGGRQRQVATPSAGGDVPAFDGVPEKSQVNKIKMHVALSRQEADHDYDRCSARHALAMMGT